MPAQERSTEKIRQKRTELPSHWKLRKNQSNLVRALEHYLYYTLKNQTNYKENL